MASLVGGSKLERVLIYQTITPHHEKSKSYSENFLPPRKWALSIQSRFKILARCLSVDQHNIAGSPILIVGAISTSSRNAEEVAMCRDGHSRRCRSIFYGFASGELSTTSSMSNPETNSIS